MPSTPIHRAYVAKDRSREPLLGPPSDMIVSRVLLAERTDIDPKEADRLAVLINDALADPARGNLDGVTVESTGSPASIYVLVPREPTMEMLEAGLSAGDLIYQVRAGNVYRAMIAAGPIPTTQPQSNGE